MAEQKKTSGFKPTLQKAKAKFFKTYYSNPAKDLKIIAVTGTSGRDITANYLQSIIKAKDEKVGLVIDPKTTSELYRKLFKIWKTGTDYVISATTRNPFCSTRLQTLASLIVTTKTTKLTPLTQAKLPL